MLPHSYGNLCLACSTDNQRANGVFLHCRMKKPKDPRPAPKGQPATAIESILFILRNQGMNEVGLQELEKRHKLFPRLIDALEEAKDFIADGSYHNWSGIENIEVLLRECGDTRSNGENERSL